jgi:hypothetical protein
MCTSEEVMETTSVPANLSGQAWVRPSLKPHPTGYLLDASGVSGSITCNGWTGGDPNGLTVHANGSFFLASCTTRQAVSCCALLP